MPTPPLRRTGPMKKPLRGVIFAHEVPAALPWSIWSALRGVGFEAPPPFVSLWKNHASIRALGSGNSPEDCHRWHQVPSNRRTGPFNGKGMREQHRVAMVVRGSHVYSALHHTASRQCANAKRDATSSILKKTDALWSDTRRTPEATREFGSDAACVPGPVGRFVLHPRHEQ